MKCPQGEHFSIRDIIKHCNRFKKDMYWSVLLKMLSLPGCFLKMVHASVCTCMCVFVCVFVCVCVCVHAGHIFQCIDLCTYR